MGETLKKCNSRFFKKFASLTLITALILFNYLPLFNVVNIARAQVGPSFLEHSISGEAGDCKAVADVDLDGDLDVFLGGHSSRGEDLRWYSYPEILDTTSGNFIAVPSDEFTTDCSASDIDGDGDMDIVAPDGQGFSFDNILWFENPLPSGNPVSDTWTKHSVGTSSGYAKDVHPADYDKDGLMDVAVRTSGNVKIYYQESDGGWTQVSRGGLSGEGMGSGDLDKDQDTDLILQGAWWENDGTRNITAWNSYSIGSADSDFKAWMDDVDGDGINDVLYSSSEGTANVSWWKAPGGDVRQGGWSENIIETSAYRAHTLQTGDIDFDGDTDVLVGHMHTGGGEIYIYYNDGSAASWTRESVPQTGTTGIHNGRLADIDQDGDLDIYGANWTGNNNHTWWENTLDPDFTLSLDQWTYKEITDVSGGISKDLISNKPSFGLVFADYNSDGYKDVFAGQNYFTNPGADMLGSWEKHTLPVETDAKLTLNVDDDNNLDIIGYGPDDNVYWLEYDGVNWSSWTIGSIGFNAHGSGQGYKVADLIPGAKPEIVLNGERVSGISEERYRINYFEIAANPEGSWIKHEVTTDAGSPNGYATEDGLDVADIDGDGLLDVTSGGGEGNTAAWWKNEGNNSWTKYQLGTINGIWTDMFESADIDGDSDKDVLVGRENSSGELYLFRNDGTSENWPATSIFSGDNVASLDSGDLDNDGDIDIVIGELSGSKRVIVLENTDGFATTPTPIVVGSAPDGGDNHVGTQLFDLDQDGDKDIVSVGFDHPEYVHLWRNDAATGGVIPSPTPIPTTTPSPTPTPVGNQAPIVDAGTDKTVSLPDNVVAMTASVTDDGLPEGSTLSYSWTQESGPGTASFDTTSSLSANVTLPTEGQYIFRLTADDSELTAYDEVGINLLPESSAFVYLNLDEGTGGIAADSSGNGNDGTINGATWSTEGIIGNSLSFDGTDDNVDLGPINVTGDNLTLAAWVKSDSLQGDDRIISKSSGSAQFHHDWMLSNLKVGSNNKLRFRLKTDSSGTSTLFSSGGTLPENEWVHVAAVYDGTQMRIYQNGELVGSQSKTGSVAFSSNHALVGANYANYEVWNGLIDEVHIFEDALTAEQIQELINKTQNQLPTAFDSSVSLDEDVGVDISLQATDPDIGDLLTYQVVDQPAHGTLLLTGDVATYTPEANYNGADSFTFKANDGTSDSNSATISLTVNPINDSPIASASADVTNGEAPLTVNFDAANSTDIDGDALTYTWDFGDTNTGTGVSPNHQYTSEGDYAVQVAVSDGVLIDTANVSIHVDPFNNPPVAEDQSATVDEDMSTDIVLTAIDTEGSPLTYSLVDLPVNGNASLDTDVVTYTPNPDYYGQDSFTFKANDGTKVSNTASVSISVNSVNDAPVALVTADPQTGSLPLVVSFDANNSNDPDGTITSYEWDFGDTLSATGSSTSHTYQTEGVYTAVLTVTDNEGGQASSSAEITVFAPNNPPVSDDLAGDLNEDSSLDITLIATDADNDAITFSLASQPINGQVSLAGNLVTYTPDLDFNGTDSFSYYASDGIDDGNTATVTLTINPVNDAPLVFGINEFVDEDASVDIALSAFDIDGDTLTYSLVDLPANGTAELVGSTVTYTPNSDFSGTDSFTYFVNDGTLDSTTATVDLTINAVNDAPIASDVVAVADEDVSVDISLQATDIDQDALSYSIVTAPTHGSITLTDNIVTYTPEAEYFGSDSFSYLANDGTVDSNTAVVDITVNPINDSPIASASADVTNGEAPLTVNFDAANSTDIDGDTLTYAWDFGDTFTETGAIASHVYNDPGIYQVTLSVSDPSGAQDTATISITATSALDGAVASYNFDENTGSLLTDISGNGYDGTINGAAWDSGKFASALSFDGVDDDVNLGNINVTGQNMTISAWVYSNGFLNDDRIISKSTGKFTNDHYWMMSIANGDKLRFRLKAGGSTQTLIGYYDSVPTNEWVHVAATYEGSSMRLYLNGAEIASISKTGSIDSSDVDVLIGANPGGYTPWNGRIDELTVYERTLSAAEIQNLASQ